MNLTPALHSYRDAADSLGFLIPVVIVTFALRRYLLRGVTFGAIRR